MNIKFMQPISLKTGLLALSLVAITSTTGGFLTACSNVSSNQSGTPNATASDDADAMQDMGQGSGMNGGNTTAPNAASMQGMEHGSGMNHSMAMDLGPADANYDLRFIDAMTVHHQGAVAMAKEAQQKSQRPEIKQLADNIVKDQNKEIAQMKQWRQAWYPDAGDKPMAYSAQKG